MAAPSPQHDGYISWLRVARQLRGMTQKQLAEQTGLTNVAISNLETRAETNPRRTTKRLLSGALGFTESDLFPTNGHSPSRALREAARKQGEAARR